MGSWLARAEWPPPDIGGVGRAAHQAVLSSGGSTANLVALRAARQWAFGRRGLDVFQDGLPPGVQARIYASGQAHHTIQRATAVLGLGRAGTRHIACDARQRIDVAALRAAIAEDERAGVVPGGGGGHRRHYRHRGD